MDEEFKQVLSKELELLEKEITKIDKQIEKSKFHESNFESEERFFKDQLSNEYYEKFQLRKAKQRIKKAFKDEITNFIMTVPMSSTLVALLTFSISNNVSALAVLTTIAATAGVHKFHYEKKIKKDKEIVKNYNVELSEAFILDYEKDEKKARDNKNSQINHTTNLELSKKEKQRRIQEIKQILNPNEIQNEKELNKQKTK